MKKPILEQIVEEEFSRFKGMEESFKTKDKESFVAFCQSALSGFITMHLRNKYALCLGKGKVHNALKKEIGESHPDKMCEAIIRGVYDKYNDINS